MCLSAEGQVHSFLAVVGKVHAEKSCQETNYPRTLILRGPRRGSFDSDSASAPLSFSPHVLRLSLSHRGQHQHQRLRPRRRRRWRRPPPSPSVSMLLCDSRQLRGVAILPRRRLFVCTAKAVSRVGQGRNNGYYRRRGLPSLLPYSTCMCCCR